MSRSQLPGVKYVYAVDYKSMIGGYRTLLVMNSVNPGLIPLSYLGHVWVTSQVPSLNTWQSVLELNYKFLEMWFNETLAHNMNC